MKRPAYEPATNPPPQKRPPVEEEDAISIPLDEEEDLALDEEEDLGISISLTDEEERLNLVSPLLTSKVTVSVLSEDEDEGTNYQTALREDQEEEEEEVRTCVLKLNVFAVGIETRAVCALCALATVYISLVSCTRHSLQMPECV